MTGKIIIVRSPESERGEDGQGIKRCIFAIDKKEWVHIGKILSECEKIDKNIVDKEIDHTSGARSCVLNINYYEMYENSCIIRSEPSKEIIEFVEELDQTSFIDELREICEEGKIYYMKKDIYVFLKEYEKDEDALRILKYELQELELTYKSRIKKKSYVELKECVDNIDDIDQINKIIKCLKTNHYIGKNKKKPQEPISDELTDEHVPYLTKMIPKVPIKIAAKKVAIQY